MDSFVKFEPKISVLVQSSEKFRPTVMLTTQVRHGCRGNYHAQEGFVVEKFHIPTKDFQKQLTVELYFILYAQWATPRPRAPISMNR